MSTEDEFKLKNKEIDDAKDALKAWFVSQDIPPGRASVIMTRCMAEQMVSKSDDIIKLERGAKLMYSILLLEIAQCLRGKK